MAVETTYENRHESTEEKVGEGVGGVAGALTGAGLGSAAGPVGTIIGGIAGALGGWWAGEKVGRAVDNWTDSEPEYREHYDSIDNAEIGYDDARVGYSVGHIARRNPEYEGRTFEDIEADLRDNWAHDHEYDRMRPYIRRGYLGTSY